MFHKDDAKHALESLPPRQLSDAFAVTFCTTPPSASSQETGRDIVRKIGPFRLNQKEFEQQVELLKGFVWFSWSLLGIGVRGRSSNIIETQMTIRFSVYQLGVKEVDRRLLTEWLNGEIEAVPTAVVIHPKPWTGDVG